MYILLDANHFGAFWKPKIFNCMEYGIIDRLGNLKNLVKKQFVDIYYWDFPAGLF